MKKLYIGVIAMCLIQMTVFIWQHFEYETVRVSLARGCENMDEYKGLARLLSRPRDFDQYNIKNSEVKAFISKAKAEGKCVR